jgi:hypothetical protein
MPTPSKPSRYPPEFLVAYELVESTREPLFIASGDPKSLQRKLWGFARALRAEGQAPLADVITVKESPSGVTLEHRSTTREGLEVAAALAQLPGGDDAEDFFERLGK